MFQDLVIFVFIVSMGVCAGGVSVNLFQLVSGVRAGFQVRSDNLVLKAAYIPLIMFGGPMILMRNAINGQLTDDRPAYLLGISALIAMIWAFVAGLFVVHLGLSFGIIAPN